MRSRMACPLLLLVFLLPVSARSQQLTGNCDETVYQRPPQPAVFNGNLESWLKEHADSSLLATVSGNMIFLVTIDCEGRVTAAEKYRGIANEKLEAHYKSLLLQLPAFAPARKNDNRVSCRVFVSLTCSSNKLTVQTIN